jgi:hypothetical protein
MTHPRLTIMMLLAKKMAVVLLMAVSAAGAFATLGDGKKKASTTPKGSLLSGRTSWPAGFFTLKSGYAYKGNQVLNSSADKKYISLNTVVSVQRGNTVYVVPLKKKAVIDKVKIEIGNRQFKRN